MNDADAKPQHPSAMTPAIAALLVVAVTWLAIEQDPTAVARLIQTWAHALPPVAALWLAAIGLGFILIRDAKVPASARVGLGMAVILIVDWVLASLGWLSPWVTWGQALLGVTAIAVLARRGQLNRPARPHWTWLAVVPGIAISAVAATCMPGSLWRVEALGYDVTSYHLQLPREWMELGRMAGLEHSVYSFLPSLMESVYYQIALVSGSATQAAPVCQLFHISLGVLAAMAVVDAVKAYTDRGFAAWAAGLLLVTPWVVITGSLAYNEMAALAFGSCGLAWVLCTRGVVRTSLAVGTLAGAATLAKLTAGPMFAVPLGVIWVARLVYEREAWRRITLAAVLTAAVGFAVLTPYFIRNAAQTGNPVFPFAASVLGTGHWDGALIERWQAGHGRSQNEEGVFPAFSRQFLGNVGFGAVGGRPVEIESRNIARFSTEHGLPLLLVFSAAGFFGLAWNSKQRHLAIGLAIMLGIQFGFWALGTHLQSRFLIPTLLPLTVAAGTGLGLWHERLKDRSELLIPALAGLGLVVVGYVSLITLWDQTPRQRVGNDVFRASVGSLISSPAGPNPGLEHPINQLPEDANVLILADNSALLYWKPTLIYHSPFDPSPLGAIIRDHGPDPVAVNAQLRELGVTHIWLHQSELQRLASTYGFDQDVIAALPGLVPSWRLVEASGPAQLYALTERP